MCVEDAVVLAELGTGDLPIANALAAFMARRLRRPHRHPGRQRRHPPRPVQLTYGSAKLTEVPQLARPSLVPPQVACVSVNCGGWQLGNWMYSLAK